MQIKLNLIITLTFSKINTKLVEFLNLDHILVLKYDKQNI